MAKKGTRRPAAEPVEKAEGLPWITPDLRPLAVEIGTLTENPQNARKHEERSVASIVESLRRYGQRKPLVANRTSGQLEAGHGTLAAARRLGWSHLAVVWVEDDAAAERGFALADNRTAELSTWDESLLDDLLSEVARDDQALYDALLLDELREEEPTAADPPPAGEVQAVPETWQIVVECRDEAEQRRLFEEFKAKGHACRLLTL